MLTQWKITLVFLWKHVWSLRPPKDALEAHRPHVIELSFFAWTATVPPPQQQYPPPEEVLQKGPTHCVSQINVRWGSNSKYSLPISCYTLSLAVHSAQLLSRSRLFVTPWTAACQASLSITNTNSWSLLKLMSIKSVMPSNHPTLCHPLLLPPSIFSSIRVFSSESVLCIRWPSIGALVSASVLPINIQDWSPLGWTGWISLQSKVLSRVFSNIASSKASILWHPAFFIVQFSHPYVTTGKTTALTRWIFVGKVMFLLLNMPSRLATAFLRRRKCFNFMAEFIIYSDSGAQKNKVYHFLLCFHIYLPWSDWTRCHDLSFLMLSFKPTLAVLFLKHRLVVLVIQNL